MKQFTAGLERLPPRVCPSAGYFRVVSYNVTASGGSPASGLNTILQAIGNEVVAGHAEPIDLITLQEVDSQATTTQDVVNLLNGLYGAGIYARGSLDGNSTGSGTQGVVFRTDSLQLVAETAIGVASTTGQPRQALRYQFQPVGYPASAAFYVFDSHYKAGDTTTDRARRLTEAQAIRADSDALGSVPVLYTGDFNVYDSAESFYQTLLTNGTGQGVDPINRPGSWHDGASFVDTFTQAPAVNPPGSLTGGGLDDRFDFQLATGELFDGVGLDYVAGTYHAFGNNGSVALNGNINDPGSTALPGLANRLQVLDLLTTVADHLPVVADYRIVTPPPTVSVQVNDGNAQRSMLTSITATFSQPITFPPGVSSAFQLQRTGPGGPVGSVMTVIGQSGNSVTLTFDDPTFAPGLAKSLIDGNYSLRIVASKIQGPGGLLDGDGNGVAGDDRVVTFHRLFGDADGDRDVDIADFAAFRGAFNYTSNLSFDSDGDGDVDLNDFAQFRQRFGQSL